MNDETLHENAVSVYNQDAMDDFPVLKAFQQYIDAEQEKARKRMFGLCITFAFVLAIVIGVFIVMISNVNSRNQELSDRLIEYAMKDRDRSPVVVNPPANQANDTVLKAMTETLAAIQNEIAESKKAIKEDSARPTAQTLRQEVERERRIQEESDKLAKARALLIVEQEKLAAEKERLRREEVDRQRRRLYPEYYGEKPTSSEKKSAPVKTSQPRPQTKKYTPSVDNYDDLELEDVDDDLSDDDAIDYFKDDHFDIPVDIKGTSAGWRVPLN